MCRFRSPLIALLMLLAAGPGWAGIISAPAHYGGHEYVLLGEATWLEAEAEAVAWGGHLAAINDRAEQSWIIATFGTELLWIGLSDHQQEGEFRWSNGDPLTFTSWDYDEPNNSTNGGSSPGGEHFVELNRFGLGLWNDLPVWSRRVGLAERVAVPEPATATLIVLGLLALAAVRRSRPR